MDTNYKEYLKFKKLVGNSQPIKKLKHFIEIVSNNDYPILILGETGVGKTLVAQLIHKKSKRKIKPFIHQGCSNIPNELFESELFGHEKGAFSGAIGKRGKIEVSNGGTLFLDEISDLSLQNQAKFLLFLDSGSFFRLGGNKEINSDLRIISASNKNLDEEVISGRFRRDLHFRLNILECYIPPLRDRKEDIDLLIDDFLYYENMKNNTTKIMSINAKNKLMEHDYPGNIRELKNILKRAITISKKNIIEGNDIIFKQKKHIEEKDNNVSEMLFYKIIKNKGNFWEIVHKPFLRRELTKFDVKRIIDLGLMETNGSYKKLLTLFNMSKEEKEYKRLMKVLSVHNIK